MVQSHCFRTEKGRRNKVEGTDKVSADDVFVFVRSWDGKEMTDGGGDIVVSVR
jgi:hypothetical protein